MSSSNIRLISPNTDFPQLVIASSRLPVTLGRSKSADIQVLDPLVSRMQCRFEHEDGAVIVKDLQSMNGTVVNGSAVECCPLKEGDLLLFGNSEFVAQFDV
ncbi:MAG: FHA domain-containing protein [Planctomycetota bacterium]|nr:FHA domain-containing protein [Planctomycetota bacterium]MDA1213426.1 FHA domain-containing protein [Planctomycetota bacterium]